jgi:hypothetical protein
VAGLFRKGETGWKRTLANDRARKPFPDVGDGVLRPVAPVTLGHGRISPGCEAEVRQPDTPTKTVRQAKSRVFLYLDRL